MIEHVGENFAATGPGGPNIDLHGGATGEPRRYVNCNLFRRRVPDGSEVIGCQIGQATIIDHLGELIGTVDGIEVRVEEDSPDRIEVQRLKAGVLGEGGI